MRFWGEGIIIFVQKKLDVLQLHIAGGQCEALQWLAHIPDDRLAVDSVIALIWLHNATTHVLHFDGEVFLMYAPHGRQSLVFCAQHSRHNVLKEQTEQQGVCLAVLNQALYFESLRSCKWMTTLFWGATGGIRWTDIHIGQCAVITRTFSPCNKSSSARVLMYRSPRVA